jgi:HPt (histidine-containing phosphotransfer) domain-containing protein
MTEAPTQAYAARACSPQMLLDVVNGDAQTFRALAAVLERETHLRGEAIAAAAAAGDARAMGFAAHTLKGTVSNVGAASAVALLQAIEHAGLREGRTCAGAQLEALNLVLQAIREEVGRFLDDL